MKLQRLPYKPDALEPCISRNIVEAIYQRYQTSVVTLNHLIYNTIFQHTDNETLIRIARGPIQMNAIQAWNYAFYFEGLKSGNNSIQKGKLLQAINGCFGSFGFFEETLIKYSGSIENPDWVWVVLNQEGSIEIIADSICIHPFRDGLIPILNCIASYDCTASASDALKHRIACFLESVDWDLIEKRYQAALKRFIKSDVSSYTQIH
jgi:Fe-Mn family superoxide dismutase